MVAWFIDWRTTHICVYTSNSEVGGFLQLNVSEAVLVTLALYICDHQMKHSRQGEQKRGRGRVGANSVIRTVGAYELIN